VEEPLSSIGLDGETPSRAQRIMTTKLGSYKWTCLVGVVFLGSLLWSVTFCDGLSDFFVFLFSALLLASILRSAFLSVTRRSKDFLYRIVIGIVFCLLIFPTISLGGFLRDRLFLTRLSRFQEVTNLLIKEETTKTNGDVFSTVVALPSDYLNLDVSDRVLISSTKDDIMVRYAMRNSNALSHSGYMYRSDDDPVALSKEYPKTGYTRVASHWFFFSE
jgi:hypothetical protein